MGPPALRVGALGRHSFPTTHEAGVTWQGLRGSGEAGRFFLSQSSLGSFLGYRRPGLESPRQMPCTTERGLLGCVFLCMCGHAPQRLTHVHLAVYVHGEVAGAFATCVVTALPGLGLGPGTRG